MPSDLMAEIEQYADKDPTLYEILRKLVLNQTRNTQMLVSGQGNPNGIVSAAPNTLYVEQTKSGLPAAHWIKTGKALNTGWVQIHSLPNPHSPLDYANIFADPTKSGFRTHGSVPPTGSTNFTAVSTFTSITWYWDGTNGSTPLTIYRANSKSNAGPIVQSLVTVKGNHTFGGLVNDGFSYSFYPYFDESAGVVFFSDTPGGVGVRHFFAYPHTTTIPQLIQAAQQQSFQGHIPLSNGAMTAAPSGGGASGGGSQGGCFHENMLFKGGVVHSGLIRARDLEVGDRVWGKHGWLRVTKSVRYAFDNFIQIHFSNGESHIVTLHHGVQLANDDLLPAEELGIGRIVETVTGACAIIEGVRLLRQKAVGIDLTFDDPLVFCGMKGATILAHNVFKI